MQSMIRGSKRGLIFAAAGVSALLLVAGLAYATTMCACGETDAAGGNGSTGQAPIATSTGIVRDIFAPTITPSPDLPVSSPAQPPVPGTGATTPSTAPGVTTDPALPQPSSPPSTSPSGGPVDSGAVPPSEPGQQPPCCKPLVTPSVGVANPPAGINSPNVSSPPLGAPAPSSPPVVISSLPKSDLPPLAADKKRVEAPIDGLSVATLESFPAQYLVQIKAGLPSGCAAKGGYEASISGVTITVKVYNAEPASPSMCTMIYGMYDLNLNLGSGFSSGQTYTVVVNGQTTTFKAQ